MHNSGALVVRFFANISLYVCFGLPLKKNRLYAQTFFLQACMHVMMCEHCSKTLNYVHMQIGICMPKRGAFEVLFFANNTSYMYFGLPCKKNRLYVQTFFIQPCIYAMMYEHSSQTLNYVHMQIEICMAKCGAF